jgi:hypothetical protein
MLTFTTKVILTPILRINAHKINTGDHWEIAFAFPQSKKIVYINSLGEQHSKIAKFIRGWRCLIYKRSMEGLDCENQVLENKQAIDIVREKKNHPLHLQY